MYPRFGGNSQLLLTTYNCMYFEVVLYVYTSVISPFLLRTPSKSVWIMRKLWDLTHSRRYSRSPHIIIYIVTKMVDCTSTRFFYRQYIFSYFRCFRGGIMKLYVAAYRYTSKYTHSRQLCIYVYHGKKNNESFYFCSWYYNSSDRSRPSCMVFWYFIIFRGENNK